MAQGRHWECASLRNELVPLLPNLRRFATLVTGDASKGDALIAAVCGRLLAGQDLPPAECALDLWVFGRLYGEWVADLRARREPASEALADPRQLEAAMAGWAPDGFDARAMAGLLASLPPQQRAAILLVHGEGLSHAQAAAVLDLDAETVASRVAATFASILETLDLAGAEAASPGEGDGLEPEYGEDDGEDDGEDSADDGFEAEPTPASVSGARGMERRTGA